MTDNQAITKRLSPYDLMAQAGIEIEAPLLTVEMKQQLAESRVPFDIVEVRSGLVGEHGEFWQFTAQQGSYKFRFNMSDPLSDNKPEHVVRDVGGEYAALETATSEGCIIGPYLLDYVMWKGGNSFYKLTAADPPKFQSEVAQESLPFS